MSHSGASQAINLLNIEDTEMKGALTELLRGVTWNFIGVIDTSYKLHPIPKNMQVQALFEYMAKDRILGWAKERNLSTVEATNIREYPDITIVQEPRNIAVDVKTTRRTGEKTVSGFTLGSYAGYFRHPDRKMSGCRIPYGQFLKHWIVGFIYTWNEDADTLHMISDVELVIDEKWKLASKQAGTGTTHAIRSVTGIDRLRKGIGDFISEDDFLRYWRHYRGRAKKEVSGQ